MNTQPLAPTQDEFDRFFRLWPSAKVVYRTREGRVKGLTFRTRGTCNGRSLWYELFADVSSLRDHLIPTVWVLGPADAVARTYIIGPVWCPQLKKEYPAICFGHGNAGDHIDGWAKCSSADRTLLSLAQRAEQLLTS
jgi:hypothetical protein